MGVRLSDLPPKVREQVAKKMVREATPQSRRHDSSPQGEALGKYHNVGAVREVGGNTIRFDSQKEARRFDELLLMQRRGMIRELKLQEDFTLQETYTNPQTGERVRAIRYRADFTYLERVGDDFGCVAGRKVEIATSALEGPPRNDKSGVQEKESDGGQGSGRPTDDDGAWRKVVEDVKSSATKTRVYEIKRKLLREKFGLEIREV